MNINSMNRKLITLSFCILATCLILFTFINMSFGKDSEKVKYNNQLDTAFGVGCDEKYVYWFTPDGILHKMSKSKAVEWSKP